MNLERMSRFSESKQLCNEVATLLLKWDASRTSEGIALFDTDAPFSSEKSSILAINAMKLYMKTI